VRLVEEIKEGGKEGKKDSESNKNDNEIHDNCVGTRHKETAQTVKQHRMEERAKKCSGEGYIDLTTVNVQAKILLTGAEDVAQ
jgi:hypothetical protein